MANEYSLSVSVVMCTYNGAFYVKEQLLSIINQTYPLREILVFDDASTDSTVQMVEEIAAQYPVVKLHINRANIGYGNNFEQGLLAATGDAIATSDQDDIWLSQKIEHLIASWKSKCPLIYCHSYATETIPNNVPALSIAWRYFEGKDGRKLFIHNTISGHTMLIRKSFLQLVLPLKNHFFYDWWIAIVAAYNGGVQYLPEILVYQRIHSSNLTHFAKGKITSAEFHKRVKTNILNSCEAAATAPNILQNHKKLALKMATAIKKSFDSSFYWPLFFLIVRYRIPFFNRKVKKIGLFSHIKYAYRLTKN